MRPTLLCCAALAGGFVGATDAHAAGFVGATDAYAAIPAAAHAPMARADVQSAAPLSNADRLGATVAPTRHLAITVALRPRTGLAAEVAAVSDPGSPDYRRFLTVSAFRARFGARPRAVAAVRAELARAGLRVGSLSRDGLSLPVRGSAAHVERAFATRLERVALPRRRSAYADVVAPTLPRTLASAVQGIVGLDSLPLERPQGLARARAHASASAGASCAGAAEDGNSATQIADAYGLDGLWESGDVGSGATVALYELEPFSAADVAADEACTGSDATVDVLPVDGGAGAGSGSGEAALDVEDVAGLAPGATIDVYEGPDRGDGPYDIFRRIVSDDAAQVISTSWGACEAQVGGQYAREEAVLFEEAAAQGQTVFAAAGDDGSDGCASGAGAAVDDPASQPDVTGVGGTSFADTFAAPAAETVWNDGLGAGGGGLSSLWRAPSFQGALGAAMREVPDVSADADPETGYAIVYDGAFDEFGGTSAAAPTWAALAALAERSSWCDGRSLGAVDPSLYALPEADFDDVTSGDNAFDGVPGYAAGAGYDMASGLGAPDGARLVPALCGASAGTTVAEPVAPATGPAVTTSGRSATTTTTAAATGTPAIPTTTVGATTTTTTTPTTTAPTPTSPTASHPKGHPTRRRRGRRGRRTRAHHPSRRPHRSK